MEPVEVEPLVGAAECVEGIRHPDAATGIRELFRDSGIGQDRPAVRDDQRLRDQMFVRADLQGAADETCYRAGSER